jgi:hypothetical protein
MTETPHVVDISKKVNVPATESFEPVAPLNTEDQKRVEDAHAELEGKFMDIGNGDLAEVKPYPGVASLTKKVTTPAGVEWKPVA